MIYRSLDAHGCPAQVASLVDHPPGRLALGDNTGTLKVYRNRGQEKGIFTRILRNYGGDDSSLSRRVSRDSVFSSRGLSGERMSVYM